MFGEGILAKLAMGAGLVAAAMGLFWYIHHLNQRVDQLNSDLINAKAQIIETDRRVGVVDHVGKVFDRKRVANKTHHDEEITKIDEQVTKGQDKQVGKLLTDFFNEKE